MNNMIIKDNARFTVLTDRLIRIEYDKSGNFEDRATQSVINRSFDIPTFTAETSGGSLKINTAHICLTYHGGEFAPNTLSAVFNAGGGKKWCFGDNENLGGTTRTLDEVDGSCEIGGGIQSRNSIAVMDDSKSLIITENGWVEPRKEGILDIYLFAYRTDYLQALKDFYFLTGKTPLIPRYALGNWWSRYYKYTQDEYKELMLKFKEKKIPLSVAVIDMDWHWVDIPKEYGTGWTGFSWNTELFPDHKELLKFLHDEGMEVSLNIHPADGIRAFEDNYGEIAEAMGVENGKSVEFDAADPKFIKEYFEKILHPLEDEGVSFWWIDWQQGTSTKIKGLDPLWILNHYHTEDNKRNGNRPLILSRYAEVGSHRYPLGFSGDTIISWESLDFQPYFTATASNIGYGWWSHDIGGHMKGIRDDELTVRWLQFGVFSPIMRLHSSENRFSSKEPWNYNMEAELVSTQFMRLRHRLIPYLYTMNYRAHEFGEPLVQPLYYRHPNEEDAYLFHNEYYFGTELIVSPITSKSDAVTLCGAADTYIPDGLWFDFFDLREYSGSSVRRIYRDINTIPVLAKAGAIIPMSDQDNAANNPKELTVIIFPGSSNDFELYEDDNITLNTDFVQTKFQWDWSEKPVFTIGKPCGSTRCTTPDRTYKLVFRKLSDSDNISVTEDGKDIKFKKEYRDNSICIEIENINGNVKVSFNDNVSITKTDCSAKLFSLLTKAQCSYDLKEEIYTDFTISKSFYEFVSRLEAKNIDPNLKSAVYDIIPEHNFNQKI